ncbi:MAG: DUF1488 domain-containing protein [Rhodospirillales bacterium]|nr:DUF1488 domain-containing protein [Rhodospirillales bacterium]
MSLVFPNKSRSFEPAQQRVRFWGHDSAIEITFFVEADALLRMVPDTSLDEQGLLSAFDRMSAHIHDMAVKSYNRDRGRSHVYVIAARDLQN